MVTDPATTPNGKWAQVAFGCSVALAYAACMLLHVVFGLFFALTAVTAARGAWLYWRAWRAAVAVPAPAERAGTAMASGG